jgi:hypothetical protein
VTYDVNKQGMIIPLRGSRDICEELKKFAEDPKTKQKMKEKKISTECPVKPVSSVYLSQLHVSMRLCE